MRVKCICKRHPLSPTRMPLWYLFFVKKCVFEHVVDITCQGFLRLKTSGEPVSWIILQGNYSQHLTWSWHDHPSGAWFSFRSLRPPVRFKFPHFSSEAFRCLFFYTLFPLKSILSSKANPLVSPPCIHHTWKHMHIHTLRTFLISFFLDDKFSLFLCIGSFLSEFRWNGTKQNLLVS